MQRPRRRASTTPAIRRRRRLLLRFTAGFVASMLLGACAAAGLAHWGLAKIDRSTVAGLVGKSAQAAETAAEPGPSLLNVLVVGSDSRDGLSPDQRRGVGRGKPDGSRTDSLMLVQLELNGRGRGAVLSFPRDLHVERCDGSNGRINAAYGLGLARDGDGPSCVVETVSQLTGVDVHHYVEISFAGFMRVVDAIGGVGLYLDEPLVDAKAHLDLPAGCVTLSGTEALGFVRARHLDNDFGRMARQQRFIKETVREASDLGILANPPRLYRVIDAAAAAVRTDDGLDLAGMRDIAAGMRRLTADGLEVHTVPGQATVSGGSWYVFADEAKARALYRSFRTGAVLRDEPQAAASDDVPDLPSVTVLNTTDRAGLAEDAATNLAEKGFGIAEVGNDDGPPLSRTRVLHPPELADAGATLAAAFPGAHVIQGVSGLPLTVKLGTDVDAEAIARKAAAVGGADDSGGGAGERGRADEAATPEPTYRGAEVTDVDC